MGSTLICRTFAATFLSVLGELFVCNTLPALRSAWPSHPAIAQRTFGGGRWEYRSPALVQAWDPPIAVSSTVWTHKDGPAQRFCTHS